MFDQRSSQLELVTLYINIFTSIRLFICCLFTNFYFILLTSVFQNATTDFCTESISQLIAFLSNILLDTGTCYLVVVVKFTLTVYQQWLLAECDMTRANIIDLQRTKGHMFDVGEQQYSPLPPTAQLINCHHLSPTIFICLNSSACSAIINTRPIFRYDLKGH